MAFSAKEMFGRDKALVGMVHVGALPGTPRSEQSVAALSKQAATEARTLVDAGFDAVLLENMHDVPYLRRDVGPEIVAALTSVAESVRTAVDAPLGIQILAGANRAALAVAHAVGARFIRAEGFVFASVADEGLLDEADAGPLLRYRKAIDAAGVGILADVKKKHSSHAITVDVDIAETARAAEFFGADAVVVTGAATAQPASIDDLQTTRGAVGIPVAVGSGVTPRTARELFAFADALIVGSCVKGDGVWSNPVDAGRAREFVVAAR